MLPAAAARPVQATGVASGLIIGFKDAPPETEPDKPKRVDRGPWASDRERERSDWEHTSRRARERVARLAKDAGVPLAGTAGAGNAQLLRFQRVLKGKELDATLRRIRLHPDVAWVEPDVLVPRLQVPDDLRIGDQWHLQPPNGVTNFAGLNMAAAWNTTTGITGDPGVVVAVVDSGVRASHPELAALGARLLPGYDMVSDLSVANDGDGRDSDPSDPGDWVSAGDLHNPLFAACDVARSSWHGTFIAGQIAAATNNAQGIAGLNWGAQVLPVRVSGKCGALLSDLLEGLRWAAGLPVAGTPLNPHPARVINFSFGGDAPCSQAYQDTINAVTNAGTLIVVAAGNDDTTLSRPADCRRVLAVTSVRKDGAKAAYANFGSRVALAAPGGSGLADNLPDWIFSIDNTGPTTPGADGYGYKQGTSFAAPQAAGVASLMLAVNPFLSPRQLIERMKAGARPHASQGVLPACGAPGTGPCNCTTSTCGAGMLDGHTAVQLATGPAVVIRRVPQAEPGSVVTLDGSGSVAIPGASIVSYQWVQVSGPPVTITSANQNVAQVTVVSEAEHVFSLTVVDNFGRTGEDTMRTVVAMPPLPADGGGGSMGRLWGLALWAWVVAAIASQRRSRSKAGVRLSVPVA